ncbi:MAG: hypothetical protein LBR36_02380 [Bacteroidales bacterium]|jgi:hypothetical protein|nr:hypothetical protein [Bacteroidales bacterium]
MKRIISQFFQKDSMWVGILIGIVPPIVLFALLWLISMSFAPEGKDYLIKIPTLILLSVFPNLFTFRYFLVKRKLERIGRGILLVTFVIAICYLIAYLKLPV